MPIPIQLGSLTTRLRNFLRIRGRVRLQLDETVVPTVQVQDLTVGPYQAGVTPSGVSINMGGAVGRQFVVFLNPDTAIPPAADLTEDIRFIGRSFSITGMQLINRTVNLGRIRVGLIPRGSLGAPTLSAIKQLIPIQNGNGLQRVPVVVGTIIAIPFAIFPAAQEIFRGELYPNVGAGAVGPTIIPAGDPEITLESTDVLIVEELLGIGGGVMDFSLRGVYQEQPQ